MKMPKIIGIDARMYFYTGIGRYIQNLIDGLQKQDVQNIYKIFLYPGIAKTLFLRKGFEKIIVKERIYTLSEQINFGGVLLKEKLDLLHVPHFNAPVWYPKKFLVTIHDVTQTLFASTTNWKGKVKKAGYCLVTFAVAQRAKKIIAVSEHTKQDLQKKFFVTASKVKVIHEGIPCINQKTAVTFEDIKKTYKIKTPFLLYVGLLGTHKNIFRLIEAFGLVKKQIPELSLLIIGEKDQRYFADLQKAAIALKVEKSVIFTGFVPEEDLPLFYQNAVLFVFPSLYEGFGFPPLEAMAYGLPVVSSKASSMPEILGQAAKYFDAEDRKDMAEKIISLFKNPQEQKYLKQLGFEQIKKYSWDKMVKETLKIYEEALD